VNNLPLWVQILTLTVLILLSAFFSISETAMMALNRHRVKHLARRGNRLAKITMWLLQRTEKLLALILIANTIINALLTGLVTALAISMFGNDEQVVTIATALVAFLLIVFAEITPKVIGATYPERIALPAGFVLRPLMALATPAIWFVNLFTSSIFKLFGIKTGYSARDQRMSPEELHSIVLESGHFIPQKHKSILLNLFDLEKISVEDVMTPRSQVEALNLAVPVEEVLQQLATCYHNKLPVYEGEINQIAGILHVRKTIGLLHQEEEITVEHFRELLTPPYFIPVDTDVFTQLQYFQENHERLGIIVDEYGEVQGLVTLEDIIEEMIGEFTTSMPGAGRGELFSWDENGECLLEGSASLRDINKHLGTSFPLDGPKTLNGLLLEQLQDIPEAMVSLKLDNVVMEIVQVQNQSIKMVKMKRLSFLPPGPEQPELF
jgi:Mg2+/Co2+ transporter CorB